MRESFLEECAKQIFEAHSLHELQSVVVLLPSRRGVYYFKKALSKWSSSPFIAPDILAIDDFIVRESGLIMLNPTDLYLDLYKIFKRYNSDIKFDKFLTWAGILINDFDRIDQYLGDFSQILHYMEANEALKRWEIEKANSNLVQKYFGIYKNLTEIYTDFIQTLQKQNKGYRGMAYRKVAENGLENKVKNNLISKYYFLGFNALSSAEEKIIKALQKSNRAELFWDYDAYYLENTFQEAGRFLRDYSHKKTVGKLSKAEKFWKESPKTIQIIGSDTQIRQVKYLNHYLENWVHTLEKDEKIAVVLADEALLLPILNSISPQFNSQVNITMGLPLLNSLIYSFWVLYLELFQNLNWFSLKNEVKIPRFYKPFILKILSHTLIQEYAGFFFKDQFSRFQQVIKKSSKIYWTAKDLLTLEPEIKVIELIFTMLTETDKTLQQFLKILAELQTFIFENQEYTTEKYFWVEFKSLIIKAQRWKKNHEIEVSFFSLKGLVNEWVRATKIPFDTEPDRPIQIMGMLETRNLDFKKIIFLSLNEGVLPQGKRKQSLIPSEILAENNLPNHNHADAIMAYHFYRVLQRTKEIVLMYVLPNAQNKSIEPSRFILQLTNELSQYNPSISIHYPTFISKKKKKETLFIKTTITIPKNEVVLQKIKNRLKKGLAISQINSFLDCSLRYYFEYIEELGEEKTEQETVKDFEIGTWLHKTLEIIDKEHFGDPKKPITKEDYWQIIPKMDFFTKEAFRECFPFLSLEKGKNFYFLTMIKDVLTQFYLQSVNENDFPKYNLSNEKILSFPLVFEYNSEKIEVKAVGIIDKLEKFQHNLRIIDFKSSVNEKQIYINDKESLISLLDSDSNKIVRQLWWYKFLIIKLFREKKFLSHHFQNSEPRIETYYFSFRDWKKGYSLVRFPETHFIEESEIWIQSFIENLLSNETPFLQTTDLKKCQYCAYKKICHG